MPRSRNIKPGLFKNEALAECSIWARYLFAGLWTLADREGRLEDRPKRIRAELLSYDNIAAEPLLRQLHNAGFIYRYKNAAGNFIQIIKFLEHQSPHYSEKESVIMPPELSEYSGHDAGQTLGVEAPLRGGRNPLIPDSFNLIPDSLEKKGASAPKEKAQNPPARAGRATGFPNDFKIEDSHRAKADALKLDVAKEFENFKTDALAKGKRFVVWPLAFHSWLSRAEQFNGNNGRHDPPPIDYDRLNREMQERDEEMERIRNAKP